MKIIVEVADETAQRIIDAVCETNNYNADETDLNKQEYASAAIAKSLVNTVRSKEVAEAAQTAAQEASEKVDNEININITFDESAPAEQAEQEQSL